MKRSLLGLWILVTLMCSDASPAQDLSFVTALFKNINSVSLFVQNGGLIHSDELVTSSEEYGLRGVGAEVYIGLPSPGDLDLELALGTGYLRGFHAKDSEVDLNGGIRSLPTIGFYVNKDGMLGYDAITRYAGLHFGILDLWNAQVYSDEGEEVALKGQTYEYGGSAGLLVNRGLLKGVFLEGGLQRRRFASVDYSVADLQENWPRELSLSGWAFSFGWQFSLTEDKRPAYEGDWVLTRVDGLTLPANVRQIRGSDGSMRTEIVGGTLSVQKGRKKEPDAYTLTLQSRDVTLDSSARVVGIEEPRLYPCVPENGTFSVREGDLFLDPKDAEAYQVYRDGDELTVTLRGTQHVLMFRKAKR